MKVLASDLDGTLLHQNVLYDDNKNALEKFISSGGFFMISTGRPYDSVDKLVKTYNLKVDYFVLLNGALITDKNGESLFQESISFSNVEKILEMLKEYDTITSLQTGYESYLLKGVPLFENNFEKINSLDEISDKNISLISLIFKDYDLAELDRICHNINEKFGNDVTCYRNTFCIDVVPKGCSKGEGVKFVCERENIDYSDLYTIGDSFNDISMFNITENSFTFTECEEGVKEHANNIVDSFAECVEDFILNEVKSVQ